MFWLTDSILRSLLTGSLYALMALGLTLTLAVVKLPNFAQAEFITIGAYVVLFVTILFGPDLIAALTLASVVAAIVALCSHKLVFRPLKNHGSSIYILMLASFAVGITLRYMVFLTASVTNTLEMRPRIELRNVLTLGDVSLTNIFVWSVPTAVLLVGLLHLLLTRTNFGASLRAIADNPELARVAGIRTERLVSFTWLLVGALSGLAGGLFGIYTLANPVIGWIALISVFAATVLGGLTSFTGTIVGAFVVGFSENTLMDFLNRTIELDFSYKPIIPFIILILVLLIRPKGLTELRGMK